MKRVSMFALLVIALALATTASAQVSTSGIVGTVTDKTGSVVPNAKVTATGEATGVSNTTTTTNDGRYSLPSLIAGSYTITVEAPGFRKWVGTKNVITVGSPAVVNVMLEVGAVTSTVQVEGAYERLQITNAMISDVIDRRAIQNLPLNGRNPLNLITLEPGLVQRSNNNAGSGTHVNGSRDRAFNVTLDGIDINEPSVPNPQSNVYRIDTNNIQEYRVVTQNPTAEYGRNSGANIAMVTRSGTNSIHGDLFEYFRNTALDANDFFNNRSGLPVPILRYNQFGADAGGPIFKDKTFWYFSWTGQRLNQTESISTALLGAPFSYTSLARTGRFRYVVGMVNGKTSNDPSLVDPRTGQLAPGAVACSATVTTNCIATFDIGANDASVPRIGPDPVMSAFANAEPAPNDFTLGDGLNRAAFKWNPPSSQPEERFLWRVDHKINESNSLFARYLVAFSDTKQGDFLNFRPEVFPGFSPLGEVRRRPSNLAVGYRHVFSPRLINEFTAGYGRFEFDFLFGRANPKFPNIPPFQPINITSPFLNQSGTTRFLTTIEYIDNLTYTRGAHIFTAGFNFRFLQHNDERSFVGGVNNAPTICFNGSSATSTCPAVRIPDSSVNNFPTNISSADAATLRNAINELLGLPSGLSQAFFAAGSGVYEPSGLYVRGARFHQYDFYGQDDWKLRPNLTLNLGLRYEFNQPGTESRGLVLRPDHQINQWSPTNPVTFVRRGTFWDRENGLAFGPRIGVAWQPFSNGKTVIRAGYGIAFDTISTFQFVPILGLVPGSSAACALAISSTSSALDNCPVPAGFNLRIAQGFPLNHPQPTATPFSFTSPGPQSSATAPPAGAIDPNLQNPTVHEWDLTIQRDLGKNITLEVGYIGKRGMHLLRAYNLNQVQLRPEFIQSFILARDNAPACTQANNCLIAKIVGNPFVASTDPPGTRPHFSSSVSQRLAANAAGSLAALIDSNFFSQMKAATGGRSDFFRPNPQFGSIFYLDSGGDSTYNALQIHLRRHEPNLEFGAAYTFAKSIDNMSVDPVGATSSGAVGNNSRTPTDIYNFRIDRGRSDFDRTNAVNGYLVWNLPFGRGQRFAGNASGLLNQLIGGWTGTSVLLFMTGEPYTVLSGNFTNSNVKVSRADIRGPAPPTGLFEVSGGPITFNLGSALPDPTAPAGTGGCLTTKGRSTSLFCLPPPGSDGNQGRNIFTGPHFINLDLGIAKNFDLTERFKLQFRADLFNAFNHPNFDNPLGSTDGTTSAFRALSASRNSAFAKVCCAQVVLSSQSSVVATGEAPRVIQLALRLSF